VPDGEKIVSLQILRFVAAMMVAASHLPVFVVVSTWRKPPLDFQTPLRLGYAGVDIFFVLSGFVIALTGPFAQPRSSGATFFWRRFRRVVPIYFILSAPVVAAAVLSGAANLPQTLSTFLFWPAYGKDFVEPYLNPGWSLCFEMLFYTAVSLILIGGRLRQNLALAAVVLAALIALRTFEPSEALRFATSPLLIEFGAGVVLCRFRARLAALNPLVGAAAVILGFALLAFDVWTFNGNPFLGLTDLGSDLRRLALCGAPATLIVAGAIPLGPWCRGAAADLLAKGGDASYSIYLTHFYSMSLAANVWWALRWPDSLWALSLTGLVAAAAGGFIAYRVIERPVLADLKKLRWGGKSFAAAN
jgi:exopolysaccharide production protein ExoZ